MKKAFLSLCTIVLISLHAIAQEVDSIQLQIEAIEQSLTYQKGTVKLPSGNATLNVPEGFRYLDQQQSIYVLTDLWGNPMDSSVLGMIVPENTGVLSDSGWAFILSFEELGYVKDNDAGDINYDELLKDMQAETEAGNSERTKLGYEPMKLIGWASAPFYDQNLKVLHWAKEIQFGDATTHTLNYNLRILGRKGVFILNAVASMEQLPNVADHINSVTRSVTFDEGHRYADFTPDVDQVAAWTIGGLVAGKVLAKVGFFALLAKFWKVIALGFVALGSGIWKYFKRKREDQPEQTTSEDAPTA